MKSVLSKNTIILHLAVVTGLMVVMLAGCKKPAQKLDTFEFGGDFELTDQDGKRYNTATERGNTLLIFFGYTNCPDVCPAVLSKLEKVYQELGEQSKTVKTLFISVDAERDKPAALKEYLSYFKFNPIGLTGSDEELQQVIGQYKGVYMKRLTDSEGGYQMDHITKIYMVDSQGHLRHLFRHTDEAGVIAAVIEQLQDE